MDKRKFIADIVKKTGVKLDEDDPAFLLVELNQLMLEESTSLVTEGIDEATKKLQTVITTNIDDFISVANEAISKFTVSTRELRAAVEAQSLARHSLDNFTSNTKKELTPKETLFTEIHNALIAHLFLFFGATLLFGFMLGVFCSNLIK